MIYKRLMAKGIESYVPLVKKTRQYTRKIKQVELPLMPCYLFVRIVKPDYVRVLETEGVTGFVKISRNLIAVQDHEIELIKRFLDEADLDIEAVAGTQHLEAGDRVVIDRGNLTGIEGHLVEQQGKHRLLVELDSMGYTLQLTVDRKMVRRV